MLRGDTKMLEPGACCAAISRIRLDESELGLAQAAGQDLDESRCWTRSGGIAQAADGHQCDEAYERQTKNGFHI